MITREEAKRNKPFIQAEYAQCSNVDLYFNDNAYISTINKIYDSFEQRIHSLESQLSSNPLQLNCNECAYSICEATTYAECMSACYKCTRQPHRIDMYTFRFKKDTK